MRWIRRRKTPHARLLKTRTREVCPQGFYDIENEMAGRVYAFRPADACRQADKEADTGGLVLKLGPVSASVNQGPRLAFGRNG